MTAQVTTLKNGIRIASHGMDHVETVSLGLWVGAGARHERGHEHGLSHLLEHMAFKGTATRSARRIAEEIEEVGGELNAATGLDSTAYFARVLKGDDKVALELIADILLNSAYDDAELEKERDVILQEIASTKDDPEDVAYELMQETAFPGQSLGRPILGTPASVRDATAGALRAFLERTYVPGNMVFSAAGAIDHECWVRHVEALFGGLTSASQGEEVPARYAGGLAASEKPFEQTHLLIGFPAPSTLDRDYLTAHVLSGLLGGGMSSRLFQEIREKRGLCYAIYSTVWALKDAGMLTLHAATGSKSLDALSTLAAAEFASIADKGPSDGELLRAKAQLKAGLLMAYESSSVRAEQMARHLLVHGRLIPPAELVEKVDAVTGDRVRSLASQLTRQPATVVVTGAGKKGKAAAKSAFSAWQSALQLPKAAR